MNVNVTSSENSDRKINLISPHLKAGEFMSMVLDGFEKMELLETGNFRKGVVDLHFRVRTEKFAVVLESGQMIKKLEVLGNPDAPIDIVSQSDNPRKLMFVNCKGAKIGQVYTLAVHRSMEGDRAIDSNAKITLIHKK